MIICVFFKYFLLTIKTDLVLNRKVSLANIFVPDADDLMYSGDVSKWKKAAYTLRTRYLYRTSSKLSGTEAKVLDYLSIGILSNSDNLECIHTAVGGTQNQWGAFNLQ